MANEISFNVSLSCNKGGLLVAGQAAMQPAMAGNNALGTTQDVGASTEALVIPAEVAVGGFIFIKNATDDVGGTVLTPTLTISTANPATGTTTLAVLLPGEPLFCKPGTNTLYGISSSGNCPALIIVTEP